MEKRPFPGWGAISPGAKAWTLFILFGPLGIAFALKALEASQHEWIAEAFDWGILALILFLCYLAFRWVFDRGGSGWLWRLDFFLRRVIARFCTNQGEAWIKWARNSKDDRLTRIMIEQSAQCGNQEGLYQWGRICKGEKREDSAGIAFLSAAQAGHPEAAWEIGEATRWGLYYMPVNRAASRKWHEFAARNGHLPSIRLLAIALETGDGLDTDQEAARRWRNRLQTVLRQSGYAPPDAMEALGVSGQYSARDADSEGNLSERAWEKKENLFLGDCAF